MNSISCSPMIYSSVQYVVLFSVYLFFAGHAHLTDFNIAAIVKEDLKATSIAGTKPYMGERFHSSL